MKQSLLFSLMACSLMSISLSTLADQDPSRCVPCFVTGTTSLAQFCNIAATKLCVTGSTQTDTLTVCGTGNASGCTGGNPALNVAGGAVIGGNLAICGTGNASGCTGGSPALNVAGGVVIGGNLAVCGLITSASGFSGPSFIGAVSSAQYVQLGAQIAPVAAGEPFTFTTAVLTSPDVLATTAVFNPPFTASGTVFTLASIGRYEVNYQMVYPTDGGVVLYHGATIPTMLPLPYTMIGKSPNGAVSGSVIVETTTPNSFLSVNAAAGNAAAIQPGPNSSTTNQNATTVSIKRIS